MALRPPTTSIPDQPGCYQFLDDKGRVLYVGKARSLRSRVSSYFQDPRNLHPRTAQMVAQADRLEWTVTSTEVEALILEVSMIQSFQPRFNIRLKDDKSYPWLAITAESTWPRPLVTRGVRRRGNRYFGPFGHTRSLRRTVDLLLPTFPLRTCGDAKFGRHERSGRPCLLFDIRRCSGPCIGAVDHETYAGYLDGFTRFFSGEADPIISNLEAAMQEAAASQNYEQAARMRDGVEAMREAAESQQLVLADTDNLDVVGLASDDLQVAAAVLHVRHGRIVGRGSSVADLVEDHDAEGLTGIVLRDFYGDPAATIPPVIATRSAPEQSEALTSWLAAGRAARVVLTQPRRGLKHGLVEMAERNAAEELGRDRLRRASDHNARSKALVELQESLDLPSPPFRIECYDMSHLQGTAYVGSMVVFEDGLPVKAAYRHFKIKTVAGNDDFAAMAEVLERRLRRWEEAPQSGSRRGFASPADLLLIDGGLGQLGVVVEVLDRLGLSEATEVASLAKRFEEVYRPGGSLPIRLPRGSEGLFLLQRIRDEAHRFAISFHRSTRGKAMTARILDGVPGLGPSRQERLLEQFGSIDGVRALSVDELAAVPWLPEGVARALFERIHEDDDVVVLRSDEADSADG